MTSATEKLRHMLDEREVKWKDYGYDNHTWWREWHAENRASANGLYVKVEAVLTPEQAIAATLGQGTLTAEDVRSFLNRNSVFDDTTWPHGRQELVFDEDDLQAMADELNATLGRGTCELRKASWDDGTCTWGVICSACGEKHAYTHGYGWNFAPCCGAEVTR